MGLVNTVGRGNSHQEEKGQGKSALWERRSTCQVQCGIRGPVEVSGGHIQETGLSASPEPWGKFQTCHQQVAGEGGGGNPGMGGGLGGGHVGRERVQSEQLRVAGRVEQEGPPLQHRG